MTSRTVSQSNNDNHIELSWDAIMHGAFTTSPARRIFEETVIARAASAKEALPGEAARIDRARDLVLANRVMPQTDGTYVVYSTSERGKHYPVTDHGCTCPDVAKAPEGRCKHLLAVWIWKRCRAAISGQPLPEAPPAAANAEAVGADSVVLVDSLATPQAPMAHTEAPVSMNTYVTIGGFRVQVTMRDVDEDKLLLRMGKFLVQFPPPEPPQPPPAPAPTTEAPVPEGWCRRHELQMTQQHNANGSWWSHRLADGAWCKGK